jgi:hypothetical protein
MYLHETFRHRAGNAFRRPEASIFPMVILKFPLWSTFLRCSIRPRLKYIVRTKSSKIVNIKKISNIYCAGSCYTGYCNLPEWVQQRTEHFTTHIIIFSCNSTSVLGDKGCIFYDSFCEPLCPPHCCITLDTDQFLNSTSQRTSIQSQKLLHRVLTQQCMWYRSVAA